MPQKLHTAEMRGHAAHLTQETKHSPQKIPGVMRPKAAAEYLGMGLSTLWRRSKQDPDFPKPFKLGPRTTCFNTTDVVAFLNRMQEVQ